MELESLSDTRVEQNKPPECYTCSQVEREIGMHFDLVSDIMSTTKTITTILNKLVEAHKNIK